MYCSWSCMPSSAGCGRFGLLLVLLVAMSSTAAVELAPELRLPPLELVGPDIRQRWQEPRNVTPRSRARPELAPLGVRIGALVLAPRLDLRMGYDDNLYATDDRARGDAYAAVLPRADLRSDWSRHALRVGVNAVSRRFQTVTSENTDDWTATTEGRLDLGRASSLFGAASVARLHEDRTSANSSGADEPTAYRVSEAGAGWVHPFGRFEARLGGRLSDYQFDDEAVAPTVPSGTLVGEQRDRRTRSAEARLRYSMWPGYGAFLRGVVTSQDYERLTAGGVNRDSEGREVSVGVDLELTDLIFGSTYVGHYRQSYEEPGVDSIAGLNFGTNLSWNPTRLSTVHLLARRGVEESIQPGASGYVSTTAALELEHELLRNLLLVAGSRRTVRDYDGIDRRERLWQHSVGANYLANRRLQLHLRVYYRDQDASGGGRRFTQKAVEQAIVFQY